MKRNVFNKLFFTAALSLCLAFSTYAQLLFDVKSLDFNTRDFDEFAPVYYNNGLVFNTYRKQHLYKSEVDLNEKTINDVYFVPNAGNGNWGTLQFFSNEINTRNHEGKCTFTKDGNTIYFTRFQNDSAGNIYKAIKSGGEWINQVLISLNNKKYRIKDPCVSADGKKLYFASMAPGGMGGYDLYVSLFERGDWSTPKNLGPNVNTKGDEVAPFIHANGKLYFSSNRLPGKGKFDIFYSREINGTWIKPVNMPEPVNSNRDDMYYISDAGDTTGYFSSNRNRSHDIFSFKSLWPKFENCKPVVENEYTYVFYEKGSVDTDTTTWLFEWDFGDGSKSRGRKAEAEHTFAATGQYIIQLNVIDTLTGEILLNEDTYPFTVEDIEQAYISSSDTAVAKSPVTFDASKTYLPKFKKIDYYYWDFGDGDTGVGITAEHVFHTPGKYVVKLCVQAAPDENGIIRRQCSSKEITVNP